VSADPTRLGRRTFVAGIITATLIASGQAGAQSPAPIFVISRQRLLNESGPTQVLREAEAHLTAELQRQIDEAKAQLAREEAELTRLRNELTPAEMEARATDFDQRVRLTRRLAQERAAAVQGAFQEARAALVLTLPPVLEALRIETGAVAILDADQVLAIDPGHDLTDRAIALFNATVPTPIPPQVDVRLTLPEAGETIAPPADPPMPPGASQ